MTLFANADQAAYWNSASAGKWVTFQSGIDATFAPINERLIERCKLNAGERVLDIGCGAGAISLDLAISVGPQGSVVGIDVSEQLLDLADRRRIEERIEHINYLLSDAQTYLFDVDFFDLLTSRFGVMFFDDPVAAFQNLARALRSGGRLVFVSWAEIAANPWFGAPRDAAVARLGRPKPASPTAPGPLAFADIGYVLDILECAGFDDCRGTTEAVDLFNPGSVREVAHLASNIGPSARIVREFDGSDADVMAIAEGVEEAFQQYAVDGGVRIPVSLNFFSAGKI
jgi:SAM-dependent methyltransferase